MTQKLLFIDEESQISFERITFKQELGLENVDVVETYEEAEELLGKNNYDCVVIEPRDVRFFGHEKDSPYPSLIRKLKADGTSVIIYSTYSETSFQQSFGMEQSEYEGYLAKFCEGKLGIEMIRKVLGERR